MHFASSKVDLGYAHLRVQTKHSLLRRAHLDGARRLGVELGFASEVYSSGEPVAPVPRGPCAGQLPAVSSR